MANEADELRALREQVAALTARVYRLEQALTRRAAEQPAAGDSERENLAAAASVPQPETAAPIPAIAPPPPPVARQAPARRRASATGDLEGTIGKLWLNRVGIAAILIGVAYFLKYAFDIGLIGAAARIIIGLIAGTAIVVWSELFRARGYATFSWSLKAVGIGTLYLSLWAAFQVYRLVPVGLAFGAMVVITGITAVLALMQDAEVLAAFALVGGFATPLLLSTGQNAEPTLFSYIALLDAAALVMVIYKPWRRLLIGSFLGTATVYGAWFFEYYTATQRDTTVFFTLLLFAIFAAVPLVTPLTPSRWHKGASATLTFLPLANAAGTFVALLAIYDFDYATLAWYAVALGAVYVALSMFFRRRSGSDPTVVELLNLVYMAVAVGFLTIAIPLKLESHWITIGWLVESAALLAISIRTRTAFLLYFSSLTLLLAVVRLLLFDNFRVDTLVFNVRFGIYLLALAILAAIVLAADRHGTENQRQFARVAAVFFNLLALRALTLEAGGYFDRQLGQGPVTFSQTYRQGRDLMLARDLSYSMIWLVYGAALMLFGFWKRSSFVRWQALLLLFVTIAKVFVYDTWNLEQGYRILSFIALGVVLMAMSYVYHRDWLRLSRAAQLAEPD